VKRRNQADDITFEIMTPSMQTNFFCSVFPSLFVRFVNKIIWIMTA
jgi:hypothetical protein